MRAYLTEAAEMALSSQHLIILRIKPDGIKVEGRVGGAYRGGIINQTIPWQRIEECRLINPVAIGIQMVEQEIEALEALQEHIGMAYQ